MTWLRRIYRATLGRRSSLYADLSEEIRQHLEEKTEQFQREGMGRRQAEQAARRAFGNVALLEEQSREVWLWPRIENILRDLRSSARLLKKSPGFTLVAVTTLALGIGANTAIFSLMNGLLLRPLPVPHADRLVVLYSQESNGDGPYYNFNFPLFGALEKHHGALQQIAAYSDWPKFQVRGNSGSIEVPGSMVSGEFFEMLQTPPLLGRYLTPTDDHPNPSTGFGVVVSESFWRTWFNRTPDVIGRKLTIANVPFTVVGVMPAHFIGADPNARPQLYVPLSAEPVIDAPLNYTKAGVHANWLEVMGRLKPGVSLQEANVALKAASDQIIGQIASDDPGWAKSARDQHDHFGVDPGSKGLSYLRTVFKKPLIAVFSFCGVMLLLACLNLASLLMARSAARERELATRLAVGATRGRLIQQLLMESLLLAALGAGIGLLAAPIVSRSLAVFVLGSMSNTVLDTTLDFRVFLFAVFVAFLAAILVGFLPALRATSGNLNDWLKDRSSAATGRERHRLWLRGLMGLEVALALILVIGSGLLATSLVRLYRTGLGFEPKGLVNLQLSMDKQPLKGEALIRWYQQFGEALSHLPGVRNVSFEAVTPLTGNTMETTYSTSFSRGNHTMLNAVAPGYFATMRIPLLSGRDFRWDDKPANPSIVILSQAAAKVLYPGRNPIGQQLSDGGHTYQVVGIAGDVKYRSIDQTTPLEAYLPITQDTQSKPSYTAIVRLDGPVQPLASAARSLIEKIAPDVPVPAMTTVSGELDDSISSQRMMAMLSSFFAVIALLVTAIGLYGVLAYSTARRTSEIGVRMALGARRPQVVTLVFCENLWSVLAGCAVGLAATLLASRVLASFLYGITPRNPWVLSASLLLLCFVAAVASLIPALRAATIDPMAALRCE